MPGTPQAIIDGYSYDSFVKNWQSKELASGGIGSQVFGPVSTAIDTWSVPLVQTTATTTGGVSVSTYINSAGQQHSLFGFVIPDRGDASHLLNGNDAVKSPYRGTTAPDVNLDNGSGQGCERHPRARYIHTECHSGGGGDPEHAEEGS